MLGLGLRGTGSRALAEKGKRGAEGFAGGVVLRKVFFFFPVRGDI